MYSLMQRYTFDPAMNRTLQCQIEHAFVPVLRRLPTFVAYYWQDSGEGVGVSLCIFEDQAGVDVALKLADKFVEAHLATLVSQPETLAGEVKVYANCGL